MTTREELREMIDLVADDDLDVAAMRLKPLIQSEPPRERPRFIGMGRSGYSDTSERVDEILRETGFGE
ncbi:hypothetical protein [Streptomyces luteolus]|uniref:Uncharacterized protein n=1 Tax=Streptomyces luteolus TaxID=3043615 RepID=A0ABT6T7H7_9ACTN|nr:hypothetical protein [Streptomyces sp. B-S-A12]MDI3423293.1 hypothetical protein [Streptomyces sp. B-S-A12]